MTRLLSRGRRKVAKVGVSVAWLTSIVVGSVPAMLGDVVLTEWCAFVVVLASLPRVALSFCRSAGAGAKR